MSGKADFREGHVLLRRHGVKSLCHVIVPLCRQSGELDQVVEQREQLVRHSQLSKSIARWSQLHELLVNCVHRDRRYAIWLHRHGLGDVRIVVTTDIGGVNQARAQRRLAFDSCKTVW